MLRFKQFYTLINEMGIYDPMILKMKPKTIPYDNDKEFELHSKVGDSKIYHKKYSSGNTTFHKWEIVENNRITMRLDTDEHNSEPGVHNVAWLGGTDNNKIKAHELYHHLITNHDLKFKTSTQSPGGFKTWQKLHKMPGINIFYNKAGMVNPDKKLVKKMRTPADVHYMESVPSSKKHQFNYLTAEKRNTNA